MCFSVANVTAGGIKGPGSPNIDTSIRADPPVKVDVETHINLDAAGVDGATKTITGNKSLSSDSVNIARPDIHGQGSFSNFDSNTSAINDANGASKSAKEMADDLAAKINKNSVSFTTPGKTGQIDLQGRSHFDKKTQTRIDTPHVQTRDLNVGVNGHVTAPRKTEVTRPATKHDVRTARELAERQGLF